MTIAGATSDPRPQFAAALDLVERQIDAMKPDHLSRPTPCAEYDVRTLLAHLVAVLRKLKVVKDGGDMTQVKDPAEVYTGDEGDSFRRARVDLERSWSSPDSALDANYTLAWGTMAGHELLDAYTHEFTVHAWDLSRATGRGDELDTALAHSALSWFSRNVPADGRSEGGRFAPAVAVADGADAYTRLAAFVGRSA